MSARAVLASRAAAALAVIGLALALAPRGAEAQGWLDRAKQKAKERVDRQVDRQTDRVLDRGDSAVARAGSAAGSQARGGTQATPVANRGGAATGSAGGEVTWSGGGALVNYDFTPGEQPLFVEDFARDNVGNFPRRLTLKRGNLEVAEWNGGRWLRSTSDGVFEIPLRGPLPERFTVEMDVAPGPNVLEVLFSDASPEWNMHLPGTEYPETAFNVYRDPNEPKIQLRAVGGGMESNARTRAAGYGEYRPFTVRLLADGAYLKAYVDGERLGNAPNAKIRRGRAVVVRLPGSEEKPAYVTNIRVMAGGRRLYDALAERGRVATQGVLFATASDAVRPESKPTLDEIGGMLRDHPELRLTIEGHTDNAGDAAANQALSERRAQAVRQALVSRYGVDGARLQARGYGAAKPAAPNTTPEGRQQNRRVELVRQ